MSYENEISALRDNFAEFYYAYQMDWLAHGQINYQAVQALWDILNNVYDNLDEAGVTLEELQPALALVEEMNEIVSDLQEQIDTDEGDLVFSGTRDEYQAFGESLLEKLYTLDYHVGQARAHLIDLDQNTAD